MTNDQIENAIAEGVEAKPIEPFRKPCNYKGCFSPKMWWVYTWRTKTTKSKYAIGEWYLNKHPLTDVAAAMEAAREAIKRVRKKRPGFEWEWYLQEEADGSFYCQYQPKDIPDYIAYGEADTPARAICLTLVQLIEWMKENGQA